MTTASGPLPAAPNTGLSEQLDALRIAVGKVDALAAVTLRAYDDTSWCDSDAMHVERMAHLLGAIADAAAAAAAVVARIQVDVADRSTVSQEEEW